MSYLKSYVAHFNEKDFKIEEDPQYGVYLYIYENGICTYDYIQLDTQRCMDQAKEDFGVPYTAWQLRCHDSDE